MEERRRHHYTFACASYGCDTRASLLVTPVNKHLHNPSEVANPDQQLGPYLRLPTGICGCFCWASQTRVQDLLHQEVLNEFSHYSSAFNVVSVLLTAVFGAGVNKLGTHQRSKLDGGQCSSCQRTYFLFPNSSVFHDSC